MSIRDLLLYSVISLSGISIANADQTNVLFDEGRVLIRCSSGQDINNELFEAAFPGWITSLQKHADAGLVARAHYLGRLKEGIFIVVTGESKDAAAANAKIVMADLTAVTQKATEKTGLEPVASLDEACQTSEIGPVAILPAK